jgi:hypothetical protein
MKTINVSDELHVKLKIVSEKSGISIQELVSLIIEKGFSSIMEINEFEIDNLQNLEGYKEDINDYIKVKKMKENDFIFSLKTELFKTPVLVIKNKIIL